MNVNALTFCLLMPNMLLAQGFAGLGTDASGFALPQRSAAFDFPADHGPHPDFRIEWWYITLNLTGADGAAYGAQWTLFRSALAPETRAGWQDPQIWFAHAAATSRTEHLHSEKLARGGVGQAGVVAEPFAAWIDDWSMTGVEGQGLDQLHLVAGGDGFSYDLRLAAQGPLVFHGEAGFSVKSPDGQASHYYSQPGYDVTGTLMLEGREVSVNGTGWLDREWSSQPLSEDQQGWDWFSLSFESGAKLMAFQVRGVEDYVTGTWIAADGRTQTIAPGQIRMTPIRQARIEGHDVPVDWHLHWPAQSLDVTVTALNDQAWNATNIAYWEGPVRVTGSHSGRGYLEMTGYDQP